MHDNGRIKLASEALKQVFTRTWTAFWGHEHWYSRGKWESKGPVQEIMTRAWSKFRIFLCSSLYMLYKTRNIKAMLEGKSEP
jgi:hypothetical protein